jgi:hypothetical protein
VNEKEEEMDMDKEKKFGRSNETQSVKSVGTQAKRTICRLYIFNLYRL